MNRIEINATTGERREITLSAEEEAVAVSQQAAWEADYTLDKRAARAIDGADRVQFEHLFNLENRVRALEARPQITKAQYRQALIDQWKTVNGGT